MVVIHQRAIAGYDCDGNCLEDTDGDGTFDEFEVVNIVQMLQHVIMMLKLQMLIVHVIIMT